MANDGQAESRGISQSIKAIWEYVKTLQGILSCLPGVITVADVWADLLGISSAIKPRVYILAIGFVVYSFFSEVARYSQTRSGSAGFERMGKRATIHFACFAGAAWSYWAGAGYLEMNLPAQLWVAEALLSGLAILAAVSVMEMTRALAIHGLRIYISNHRP